MWKLSIVDDQGQKTVVNLVRDEYTVGRAEGSSIRLTERNVSRRHALVLRTKSGFLIEDCGSYNGVYLNGVRVSSHRELAHKDLLQIGDYRVEVIDEDLATQEQGHHPFPASVSPISGRLPNRLVVLIGPRQGAEYPLEAERHLLGRGEECDIALDHSSVSRIHAEVRQIDVGRFEIIDKASANGLRINGRDMPRALLDSRDVVELGDVVLKFIPEGQVFRASPAEGQRIAAWSGSPPPAPKASGMSRSMMAALGGAAIAIALGVVLIGRAGPGPEPNVAKIPAAPPVAPVVERTALDEAERLLGEGDWKGAHELIRRMSPDDPLRKSPRTKAVEASWARSTIDLARAEDDKAVRSKSLDEVAGNESVPSELRDEAFALLKEEESPSIDLSELGDSKKTTRTVTTKKKIASPHDP